MKKHHHVLYACVFILLVLQTISFISVSVKVTQFTAELAATKANLTTYFDTHLEDYAVQTQNNFNEITKNIQSLSDAVSEQSTTFQQELSLLKLSQDDFSSVAQEAVKGVATISTDKSMGSGFFIDASGYVVTNNHVIDGARKISVLTYDKKTLPATVMGVEATRDVAVLKVDGTFTPLALADSDAVPVGRKVIAIGNPLGLSFTVTEGIISALHRKGPNGLEEYLQTDVPLNPGNSGGPLIDSSGKVVGMNNYKAGEAENIGFALESNVLRNAVNRAVNTTLLA